MPWIVLVSTPGVCSAAWESRSPASIATYAKNPTCTPTL
jgi:hypothetical protein